MTKIFICGIALSLSSTLLLSASESGPAALIVLEQQLRNFAPLSPLFAELASITTYPQFTAWKARVSKGGETTSGVMALLAAVQAAGIDPFKNRTAWEQAQMTYSEIALPLFQKQLNSTIEKYQKQALACEKQAASDCFSIVHNFTQNLVQDITDLINTLRDLTGTDVASAKLKASAPVKTTKTQEALDTITPFADKWDAAVATLLNQWEKAFITYAMKQKENIRLSKKPKMIQAIEKDIATLRALWQKTQQKELLSTERSDILRRYQNTFDHFEKNMSTQLYRLEQAVRATK